MADRQNIEFSRFDLEIMQDALDIVRDRLRHYPDGEMGWDEETVKDFDAIESRFYEARKAAGLRW